MKIIKNTHKLDFYTSKIIKSYFNPESLCVFDIETLGLNPSHSPVVLAALLDVQTNGDATVTQYFIENLDEEEDLLLSLCESLNTYETILTYNGRHFDLPFIKKRAEILGLSDFAVHPYNFDLYLAINGHPPIKELLQNLKQVSVEKYMGIAITRDDEISGKESVQLYYDYLAEKNDSEKENIMSRILLHNHDDVVQLYRILPILQQLDLHKTMNKLGFYVAIPHIPLSLSIAKINLTRQYLTIEGSYDGKKFSYEAFQTDELPYSYTFTTDYRFRVLCPVYQLKGSLFINLRQLFPNDTTFLHLGGYINGFLILAEKNEKRNFPEINIFSKKLLEKIIVDLKDKFCI